MILEEETFEAFGRYQSDSISGSSILILAACELCGEFRVTFKNHYHTFCNSCSQRLNGRTEGKNNPNYHGGKIKCFCLECNRQFETTPGRLSYGKGKYCCPKCYHEATKGRKHNEASKAKMSTAQKGKKNGNFGNRLSKEAKARISVANSGTNSSNWKGGEKLGTARKNAKRKKFGYTILSPLADGEVGHHVTNEYVIGIPKEVHIRLAGPRKKHRALVLEWLKDNDRKKYEIVFNVLTKEP